MGASAAAEESLRIFTNRYKGGVDTYLQVITAQTAALTNQRTEVDIRRRRMDASVLEALEPNRLTGGVRFALVSRSR